MWRARCRVRELASTRLGPRSGLEDHVEDRTLGRGVARATLAFPSRAEVSLTATWTAIPNSLEHAGWTA
eukprot:3694706-Prymnesium_polylepis.1